MKKAKFPKVLYAKFEQEKSSEQWLNTSQDYATLSEPDGTVHVGEYKLVRVRKLTNKTEISG